jgi:hypothetical protein
MASLREFLFNLKQFNQMRGRARPLSLELARTDLDVGTRQACVNDMAVLRGRTYVVGRIFDTDSESGTACYRVGTTRHELSTETSNVVAIALGEE